MTSAETLVADSAPVPDGCGRDDDIAGLFYTGGTTGRPKGVMLSHRGLITNFLCTLATMRSPEDQVFLHSPPMFHLAGAIMVIGVTLVGGTHVVIPGFTQQAVVEALTWSWFRRCWA